MPNVMQMAKLCVSQTVCECCAVCVKVTDSQSAAVCEVSGCLFDYFHL